MTARKERDSSAEVKRLHAAIMHAPCPWSACCRESMHPNRQGEVEWRRCWKEKALAPDGQLPAFLR